MDQTRRFVYSKVAESHDDMVQYVNTPSCGTRDYPNFAQR